MADTPIKTSDGYTAEPLVLIDPVTGRPYSLGGAVVTNANLPIKTNGGHTAKPVVLINPVTGEPYSVSA